MILVCKISIISHTVIKNKNRKTRNSVEYIVRTYIKKARDREIKQENERRRTA